MQFICGGTFDAGANPDNYKRAEICRQRMGPVFKRIAMNYPPILFHPINSITAYKGQIIYDTPETEAKAQTPVPYLQWQPAPGVTPPTPGPDGRLSDLILPPPAVAGQISPAGPAPAGGRRWVPARCRAQRPPTRCPPSLRRERADDARVARRRMSAAARSPSVRRVLLLAGCQFGGLNSLDMPGTAGHGSGSYTITVELPDVATLPQNSPVMVDDVTVGSVSGIEAVQRPDGTFYAAVKLSLDRNVDLPAERDGEGRADLAAGFAAHRTRRAGRQAGRGQARGGLEHPAGRTGRYPTTEEVLSSLGVVVNKGNLGALQDITDETYAAVAGRAGSFADLIPRLAELTSSLDQQTTDIIAAADGLDRFAGILARGKDSLGRTLDTLPAALKVLNDNRANIVDAFTALRTFAERRVARAVGDQGRLRRRLQGPLSGHQGVQRQCRRLHQGPRTAADVPVPLQVPAQRRAR